VVADRDVTDVRADRGDGSGALVAGDEGSRHRIPAFALVDVDVVHAGCGDVDEHLAAPGWRRGPLLQLEDVGTTRALDHDRLHP
jgi:hypothetical protein